MKVTYNWLKQYIDLTGISPEELAEVMTRGGLEVEGYEKRASGTNLVIGKVLSCIEHPNSDHLHVCQVDTGDGVRQIVCGAPNVAAGQKVIVALPGCVLPGGEIKSGSIRGQQSDGMICALFELGVDRKQLTEQQLAGIEVLPEDAPVGERNVLGYLNLDDTVYDVSLTPNRADCLAMWSLGKEVGALLNREVKLPDYSYKTVNEKPTLKVSSETARCPLFEGRIVNHVTIKPSPKWLQDYLHAVGIKAINNVVDISNFVMLETGQPLHFYDLAKIPLKEITVKDGINEDYTALDGITYHLEKDDILITTGGNVIGIGGVMGGDDSKIDENTKGIIIEAATFNAASIRQTARRLNLETEAATHFIKGIDPCGGHKAVERSVQLLIELADASGIEENVIYGDNGYKPVVIDCSVKRINGLLGTSFSADKMFDTFKRLDFAPEMVTDDCIRTHIPSYRTDITLWQDLAEEVIRLLGYDNIVSTLPVMETVIGGYSEKGKLRRQVQHVLNGRGLSEVITYSLVSKARIEEGILPIGEPVRIANAMSEERAYYRTSLLPSLLETVSYNLARNNDEYALFEIADVYSDDGKQDMHLSIALSNQTTYSKWQGKVSKNDFYTLKGLLTDLLEQLGYRQQRIRLEPCSNSKEILNPYKSADIYIDNQKIGVFGVVHPLARRKYDLDECVLAEISLTDVTAKKAGQIKFTPVVKYPEISYDLAMVVSEELTAQEIEKVIKKAGGHLLKHISIFDVYRGANIPEGKKSIALSVSYQANDHTLAESEIMPFHNEVIKQLKAKLEAVIRDN